jgi:hypothetical protein
VELVDPKAEITSVPDELPVQTKIAVPMFPEAGVTEVAQPGRLTVYNFVLPVKASGTVMPKQFTYFASLVLDALVAPTTINPTIPIPT